MVRDDVVGPKGVQAKDTPAGYGPADLLDAYDLPAAAASSQTVAIVDAFDNPNAEADLAVYRQQYGLPACTTANGCFKKVDQRGGTTTRRRTPAGPARSRSTSTWSRAICPTLQHPAGRGRRQLHRQPRHGREPGRRPGRQVRLQQLRRRARAPTRTQSTTDAVLQPPRRRHRRQHAATTATASSYPAASPYVTSVGGTSLVNGHLAPAAGPRAAWDGAGQRLLRRTRPSRRSSRTPAAPTAPSPTSPRSPTRTPASRSTTYGAAGTVYGGTSVVLPDHRRRVYALGGTPAAGSEPNSYPYDHPADLNDVTSGSNGSCSPAVPVHRRRRLRRPDRSRHARTASRRSAPARTASITGTVTDAAPATAGVRREVTAGDVTAHDRRRRALQPRRAAGHLRRVGEQVRLHRQDGRGRAGRRRPDRHRGLRADRQARVDVSGTRTRRLGPRLAALRDRHRRRTSPTAVAYTDPETGRYTLTLPADDTYTLQVDPLYPGLRTGLARRPRSAAADAVHDVDVAVDQTTCAARPATATSYAGASQPFDGTTAPERLDVDDKAGNGRPGSFDDPGARGNNTGGTGGFAIIDSDHYGSGNTQDTSLISPVTDLSARTPPDPDVRHRLRTAYSGQTGDVDLSVDGGTTWTTVRHDTASQRGPRTRDRRPVRGGGQERRAGAVPLHRHVRLLVAGRRRLRRRPQLRPDARRPGRRPGDRHEHRRRRQRRHRHLGGPAGRDGDHGGHAGRPEPRRRLLLAVLLVTGSHEFTATAGNYGSADVTANVAADWATAADFALSAPRQSRSPRRSITKTVGWQGSGHRGAHREEHRHRAGHRQVGEQPAVPTRPPRRARRCSGSRALRQPVGCASRARPAGAPRPRDAVRARRGRPSPTTPRRSWTTRRRRWTARSTRSPASTAREPLDKAYAYDPATQAWTAHRRARRRRARRPQAAAIGGKLYVSRRLGRARATRRPRRRSTTRPRTPGRPAPTTRSRTPARARRCSTASSTSSAAAPTTLRHQGRAGLRPGGRHLDRAARPTRSRRLARLRRHRRQALLRRRLGDRQHQARLRATTRRRTPGRRSPTCRSTCGRWATPRPTASCWSPAA